MLPISSPPIIKFGNGSPNRNGVPNVIILVHGGLQKERLIKFHGIFKEKFPLYLKEMEFRYNNRDKPLFPILVQYLCDLVANRL